jgi:hypothetical protein
MTTTHEYRDFAIDCLRWADEAPDASQRQTLVDIARMWMATAYRLDMHICAMADPYELTKELRAKLD